MILGMLRTAPQPRPKHMAPSGSSGRSVHTVTSTERSGPLARPSAAAVGQACERFLLELPVPVVLVALWLFGVLLLGSLLSAVLVASYWTQLWILAAMAQL